MHRNVSFHTCDTESTWNGVKAVRGFGAFTSVEELQRPRMPIRAGPRLSSAVILPQQISVPSSLNNPYVHTPAQSIVSPFSGFVSITRTVADPHLGLTVHGSSTYLQVESSVTLTFCVHSQSVLRGSAGVTKIYSVASEHACGVPLSHTR